MVLVELPFIVRPHVPDRPRRLRKQQATVASLCLGKELKKSNGWTIAVTE
jgi:hypothetical protein